MGSLTLLALIAFAANSLLCRAALREGSIDPVAFTTLRLASGALMLALLGALRGRGGRVRRAGDWLSALALFGYALGFSLAYVGLDAGTGALILFGAVQVTMHGAALRAGERPTTLQWVGLGVAMAGLVCLVLPGLVAPPPGRALLMAVAGACWGMYSLRARAGEDALAATTGNFVRTLPLALVAVFAAWGQTSISQRGAWLAALSGAMASGLGYAVWYAALRGLRRTSASLVQLSVPVLAAAGGVLLLGERLTSRFVLASLLTLGGIAAALLFGKDRN